MHETLDRVLNLVQRTGDACIVMPPEGEPFAVLALAKYERLVEDSRDVTTLTEEELLDRINRDIALWKNEQQVQDDESMDLAEETGDLELDPTDFSEETADTEVEDFEEDPYYFESV